MKRSGSTEEQMAFALRQAESGVPVVEVCRKMGVSEQTFYRWKKLHAGMGVAELRRLKQFEEENRKLKALAADLRLDKQILRDALKGKLERLIVGVRWRIHRGRSTRYARVERAASWSTLVRLSERDSVNFRSLPIKGWKV